MVDIASDPRLDPRIKAMLAAFPTLPQDNAVDRDTLVAEANTPEALENLAQMQGAFAMLDTEEVAPSAGLDISTKVFESFPDGNAINVQFIRPQSEQALPCVYYIHGGGMQTMSCYDGMYKSWGRIIAQQGVAVAMVDFRNCLNASSAPEIEPFPAGLNDCVSGVKWVLDNATDLGQNWPVVISGSASLMRRGNIAR